MEKITLDKSLENIVDKKIQQYRINAEIDYTQRERIAFAIPEFKNSILRKKELQTEICELEKQQQDATDLKNEVKEINKTLLKLIADKNLDLKIYYNCNKCNDTGYVNNKYCSCKLSMYYDELFKRSNLPLKFKNATYSCEYLENKKATQTERFSNLKNIYDIIINDFDTTGIRTILISGDVGVGKTYYSICLANSLLRRFKKVYYVSINEFTNIVVDKQFNRLDDVERYNSLKNSDFLVIDDLGTENIINNLTLSNLLEIVDYRLNHEKMTLVSTNLKADQLQKIYGERLVSRLADKSYAVVPKYISGDDLRKK